MSYHWILTLLSPGPQQSPLNDNMGVFVPKVFFRLREHAIANCRTRAIMTQALAAISQTQPRVFYCQPSLKNSSTVRPDKNF